MKLEFLIAFLSNLRGFFQVAALIIGCCYVLALLAWVLTCEESDVFEKRLREVAHTFMRWAAAPFVISLLIAAIPTPGELWEARIALIKFQIASPQNVEEGARRVNEVADALECKYLGQRCPGQKEKK